MKIAPTYQHFGHNGALINWPSKIDRRINDEVLQMDSLISGVFGDKIVELVPSYCSLAVYLKAGESVLEFIELLKDFAVSDTLTVKNTNFAITIPVCYEPQYALDLDVVARYNKLTATEVVRIHTNEAYNVFFLGFLPGFPYLGGLSESLHTPRKKTPRQTIEKGSVAIGGKQTGVYTMASPGGWNIIGKSPLDFFSFRDSFQCLLRPGDVVKFDAISGKEYEQIKAAVIKGTFKVGKEVYSG